MGRDGVDEEDVDRCDIDSMISTLGFPAPGSNRGYKPEEIIKSFLVSVWCGANRFMHTEVTRQDAVIRQIFGWERICGQDTYKRFFGKFTQGMNQRGIYVDVSVVFPGFAV